MIRIHGDLELRSDKASIRIFRENGNLMMDLSGWPRPLRPSLNPGKFLPLKLPHEAVTVRFNRSYLATIQQAELTRINFFTALKAYFAYLISRFT